MNGPPSSNYPSSVNPYPTHGNGNGNANQQPPPPQSGSGSGSGSSSTPQGPPGPNGTKSQGSAPSGGPGSGFPPRSGLAGLQPNSYAGPPTSFAPGAGMRGGLPEEKNVAQMVRENTSVYGRKYQALLDRSTPHVMERWLATLGLFILFALNVVFRQGWFIVCYALAIYMLNLFLAFLQPRFDPSLADDLAADEVEEGAPGLPGSESKPPQGGFKGLMAGFGGGGASGSNGEDEEFRPFIRRLPEFKFWYSATKANAIALFCTITRATDVPVYWPILLIYFLTLFGLTMRRQIQHMVKYKYIPFDLGKKRGYGKK